MVRKPVHALPPPVSPLSGLAPAPVTADRTGLAAAALHEGWVAASGDLTGRAYWGDDAAIAQLGNLMKALVTDHQVDPKRLYLVGFSMGGGTALLAAERLASLPYRPAAV